MTAGGENPNPTVIQRCTAWGVTIGFALAVLAKISTSEPLVPLVLTGVFVGGLLGATVGGLARLCGKR
ncbi:MAG TPA: hypothetical protein VMM76_14380 [Pirellulaceae bacterium]|nr:hypothetical protein [Pirellulaceae bacterium]